MYEIGERLYWFDEISVDADGNDLPNDAPERFATVTALDSDGTVYVEFDDGLEDWMNEANVQDFMERVTWDTKTS